MRSRGEENQLELFRLQDSRSIEKQIKRLDGEIVLAIRNGDYRRAASLTLEQKSLLRTQIDPLV